MEKKKSSCLIFVTLGSQKERCEQGKEETSLLNDGTNYYLSLRKTIILWRIGGINTLYSKD